MTKRILLAAISAGMCLVAGQAGAREFADIYTECGLGALIAPNNSAVAAVTNVTWDLGTTAISSNASSADTCSGGKTKTAAYVFQQYAQIEKDLSQGNGKHLTALMETASCDAGAASALRASFADSVSRPEYVRQTRFEKAQALFNQVQKTSCQVS